MKWSFSNMFKDSFRGFRQQLDDAERRLAEADKMAAEAEATASKSPGPGDNETVTTKTEEMRPDGTRVVTTVTRTRLKVSKPG